MIFDNLTEDQVCEMISIRYGIKPTLVQRYFSVSKLEELIQSNDSDVFYYVPSDPLIKRTVGLSGNLGDPLFFGNLHMTFQNDNFHADHYHFQMYHENVHRLLGSSWDTVRNKQFTYDSLAGAPLPNNLLDVPWFFNPETTNSIYSAFQSRIEMAADATGSMRIQANFTFNGFRVYFR
jgi:hypothetical protein